MAMEDYVFEVTPKSEGWPCLIRFDMHAGALSRVELRESDSSQSISGLGWKQLRALVAEPYSLLILQGRYGFRMEPTWRDSSPLGLDRRKRCVLDPDRFPDTVDALAVHVYLLEWRLGEGLVCQERLVPVLFN